MTPMEEHLLGCIRLALASPSFDAAKLLLAQAIKPERLATLNLDPVPVEDLDCYMITFDQRIPLHVGCELLHQYGWRRAAQHHPTGRVMLEIEEGLTLQDLVCRVAAIAQVPGVTDVEVE